MKIALIGYMGSGKTTVGKALAAVLDWNFLDLDDFIVGQTALSIPEFFARHGEIAFRKKEHELLEKALALPEKTVLSLGGGTPVYAGNMNLISEHTAHSYYLQYPVPDLAARLRGEKASRPLIADLADADLEEFIGKHLFERQNFYNLASHRIACSGKSVHDIVHEITCTLV